MVEPVLLVLVAFIGSAIAVLGAAAIARLCFELARAWRLTREWGRP